MLIHTVQLGDTVQSIANKYNISTSRLETDNNLIPNYLLNIGQALIIAPPKQTYTVKEGDTLSGIADSFGVNIKELLRYNPQIADRNYLLPGEEMIISYPTENTIKVIGYTTVFISEQVLRRTLPSLTYLTVFNYSVNAVGDFSDINDENIIKLAKEYGVAPIMFVSAMTEQGRGNYSATHAIFNNLEAQNKLIDNILVKMKEKGYVGVNLAFYSVLYQDLPLYVSFVESITERLNSEGYEVFVTMTPHTFSYQPGVAYEKSYYADIGKVANYIILISYLWSQAYISEVAQTTVGYLKNYLDYVITQINPKKIFVGLERIAYDWELPYIEGETLGTSLTNLGAINLANQLGSNIEFDEATQTPYFYYNSSGIEHFVWFKDARSVTSIMNLVDTYGLAGIAVWNILYYSSQTWLTIYSQYNIEAYTDNFQEPE